MIRILNSHLFSPFDIDQKPLEGIFEKVSILIKKTFNSFCFNKKMIMSGVYSYLLIQNGVHASGFIQVERDRYINCEKMLCNAWDSNIPLGHQLFSPIIQFRCDANHPYYAPFPFIDKCMNTLCDYLNKVERTFSQCEPYNNFSSDPLDLFWRELCPNKQSMRENLMEMCSAMECNENDIFRITIENNLQVLCSNNRVKELLHVIYKFISKSKKIPSTPAEWNKKDLLIEFLLQVVNLIGDIATYSKKIHHLQAIISPTQIENKFIYNLRIGLRELLYISADIVQNITADFKSTEHSSDSFERTLLKISNKLKNLFTYNISQGELGNSIDQFAPYPTEKTLHLFSYLYEVYDALSLPALPNGASATKGRQYELLLHSIHYWDSSYCFLDHNIIWCRLPLISSPRQINQIFLRSMDFYSKNLYCHFIKDDYWCDFGKFLKRVCENRNITKIRRCPWDHMILEVKKTPENIYQINLVGDCYHEVFTVKECGKKHKKTLK